MNEEELNNILAGCKAGLQASQHRLYNCFYNYAMTIARRYVGAIEECEEVVNDSFMKVFKKIEQFEGTYFKAWLRKIVVHTSIDRIRAQKRLPRMEEIENLGNVIEIEAEIIARLTKVQIQQSILQLSPAYRTVLNLYIVDEFSHEEIAQTLGISVGTSKSNLARARVHLKRILEHEEIIRNT